MRVAIIDIGSNSVRLLIAEVDRGAVAELARESRVTRLAAGVDAGGGLSAKGIGATTEVIDAYLEKISSFGAERLVAIATSAVRDAPNGREFLDRVGAKPRLETWLLDGRSEARLSYKGALTGHDGDETTLLVDIGGGSTELVVGRRERIEFHDSLQLGVVRHSERHIHTDPPQHGELEALAADASATIEASLAAAPGIPRAELGVAVAGTATSLAAIDLGLERHDPQRVQGHRLGMWRIDSILARLAAVPEPGRRQIAGLHPDRAPTIVAGVVILIRVMRAFGLKEIEVSERDILWGAALEAA